MTHEPIYIGMSFKDALLSLQTEYRRPLAPLCAGFGGQERGNKVIFPKTLFSQRMPWGAPVLYNSSTRAHQPNKSNTQAPVTPNAPAPGGPITKLTHATGKSLMRSCWACTIQTSTTVSRGGALQFLGIKYTLTAACFYEPLLGKVNAIPLRLVMIDETAHLPPS